MKSFFGLLFVVAAASAAASTVAEDSFCYAKTEKGCADRTILGKCNAGFGGFKSHVNNQLNNYMCEHIGLSYKYLRLATNFNSYIKDRGGLYKLYKSLSDETWENALKLAKYITKRGGRINVSDCPILWKDAMGSESSHAVSLTEMGSLTSALDWHKKLAEGAHTIHKHVSTLHSDDHKKHYDPEVSSFIEKNYVHEHAEKIRTLTGHVNDLVGLVNSRDAALGYYLFDEHLKKL